MKHSGISQLLIPLVFVLTFSAGAYAQSDQTSCPTDTAVICDGETLFDTLVVSVPNPEDPDVAMALVSGPGSLTYAVSDKLYGYYQFTPTVDTAFYLTYRVWYSATDSVDLQKRYVVYVDESPEMVDQYNAFKVCWPGPHYLKVYAWEPESSPMTWELVSGPGSIDNEGWITYTPDTAGVYVFEVAVMDDCSRVTAMVYDTIRYNSDPLAILKDSVFSLCEPGEICFEVTFSDPDGDAVWFSQVGGPGTTTTLNDSTGLTCFTPAAEDSAWYEFIYSYLDDCEGDAKLSAEPQWLQDTLRVLIVLNQPPRISCPPAQEFFTCVADTFCFDVEAYDPEMGSVTFAVLSGNATVDESGRVCFEGQESTAFDVVIVVTDECGLADTCMVPVTVHGNRPPYVMTAADFSMTICAPETVCFSATADDPDLDIATVTSNFGAWDDETDRLCFTADTAGVYTLIVTATDSCGATDADTTVVTIDLPAEPVVDLGADFTASLCGSFEVCVDASITADTVLSYILPMEGIFSFDPQTNKICFTPDTAGAYTIVFGVLSECEMSDRDTVVVTVEFPPAPYVDLGPDQDIRLCEPSEICVDVATVTAFASLTPNIGTYNAQTGQVCLWADTSGVYELIVSVVDSCEMTAADTVLLSVDLNTGPMVSLPADTSFEALCEPESLCVTPTIIDTDGNLASITVNGGPYDPSSGPICLWLDANGTYEIVVSAIDSCGLSSSDTMTVTAQFAEPGSLSLGDDFSVSLCAPEEICIDVAMTGAETVFGPNFGTYNASTQQICFTPDTAGQYRITFGIVDVCGQEYVDTVNISVTLAPPPFVNLPADFHVSLCAPEEICVDVSTIDVYQSLTTSIGSYNAETGQVCFFPETAGSHELIVNVVDSCGTMAADTMYIGVGLSNPPVISPLPDTSMYLCYSQWICLPLTVTDPDNDIDTVFVNRGMVTDDGRVCFVPYNGGEYDIIVTAIDSCGNQDVDTAHVTIITDEHVNIECPTDTTVFTCSLVDTFCFPVPGVPEGAEVTVSGINTWWNAESQTVCFWSQCSNQNRIQMTVTTPCNEYHCDFTVTILCNSAPVVFLPGDTTIAVCEPGTYCLPAGISDVNRNIESITVTGGVYNPRTNRICVDVTEPGTYTVFCEVVDSCGLTDSDQMNITLVPNQPPTVSVVAPDTAIRQCVPEPICLPVTIDDPEGQAVSISFLTDGFSYDATGSEICFTPDTSGTYCGTVIVADICGLTDTANFCVTVTTGDYVEVTCPIEDTLWFTLCEPGQICTDLPISGSNYSVTTNIGAWANDQFCFTADTSGVYNMLITAAAECNTEICEFAVAVTISEPVAISCPPDTSVFSCAPDTICMPFAASVSVASVTVLGDAYIDGMTVCVPIPSGTGSKTITLIGTGECGADTCSFTVTYSTNRPPAIVLTTPPAVTTCATVDVCVAYQASDPDSNIVSIEAGAGVVGADSICFADLAVGSHQVIAVVTDACGLTAADTITIRVLAGQSATIICPTSPPVDTICAPDTVCVAAPVSPSGAVVTVTPMGWYNPATGQVCIPVSQTGTINVQMVAEAECGNDTCGFAVSVVRANPVTVTVPSTIDTLMCLSTPQTICYPVTVSGTGVKVTVTSPATYSGGQVCLTVTQPGTYPITLTAEGYCNTMSRTTQVVVQGDQAPVLTVPGWQTFERCADDTDLICIDGIYATDVESTPTLTRTCGAGDFTLIETDSGSVCFVPDTFGVYTFCFEATDGCNTVYDTMYVEVLEEPGCEVCLKISLDGGACTPVGVTKQVAMYIESKEEIGGFDILLTFDKSVLTFSSVARGESIQDWEYFTYRLDDVSCGTSCSNRFVRLVGIADMNNGAIHPPAEALLPNGLFATLEFYVANDQTLGDQFIPIKFYWFDCGDNSFSDPTGYNMMVDLRIFDGANLVWDEWDDATYPESSRPIGLGAPDNCFGPTEPGKPAPVRCVEFVNDGIYICHPDSLDDRGDVNLNGVANEISDVVVFSNYFVYGMAVFTVNVAGQTAATDVNADGLTLTVADLVYLIRIVVGDADPIPRLAPRGEEVALSGVREQDLFTVTAETPGEIGGLLLTYQMPRGVRVDHVEVGDGAAGMDLMWNVLENQLRVLVFDMGRDFIEPGRQDLIQVRLDGSGDLLLAAAEVVDYQGCPYEVAARSGVLPGEFSLNQNYPNPFNPSTIISFSLTRVSDWALDIYNVNGALVRSYRGTADAGTVQVEWDGMATDGRRAASGVYFYRLEAGEFTDTKKMVLLK